MDKKELQEQYMKFQMLQQQAMRTQKQVQALDEQGMELKIIEQGIKDFAATPLDTEILVPLSSGIFVKAKLTDNKEVIVNVGSNVTVKKTMKEAEDLVATQTVEIRKVQEQLLQDLTKMEVELKILEHNIMNAQG